MLSSLKYRDREDYSKVLSKVLDDWLVNTIVKLLT